MDVSSRKKKMKHYYTRNWFIGEIAARAGFTKKDVALIITTFIQIVFELVYKRELFSIHELFTVRYSDYTLENFNDFSGEGTGKNIEVHKLYFKPAQRLQHMVNGKLIPLRVQMYLENEEEEQTEIEENEEE